VKLSNPKIEGSKSLQTLIGDINRKNPAEYQVVGTIEVPDWRGFNNHFEIGGTTDNWAYMGETNEIPDQDDNDQYQCFALATQRNAGTDTVFLVGFRENEAVGLYTVSTGSIDYGHLAYVTVFNGWEGSQWRYGVGLQICGAQHIRIFGCSEDPSGDRDDYHFPIYYWG